jgi:hypothetical protein
MGYSMPQYIDFTKMILTEISQGLMVHELSFRRTRQMRFFTHRFFRISQTNKHSTAPL